MKPNKRVIEAIKDYFYNRSRTVVWDYSSETKSGLKAERNPNFHWDKEGDLNKLFAATKRQGFVNTQACAGTFWLTYKTPTGKFHTLKTDEDLFPKFELVKKDSI